MKSFSGHSPFRRLIATALMLACWQVSAAHSQEKESTPIVVVVGAAGAAEFGEQFTKWAEYWKDVSDAADAELTMLGLSESEKLTDGEQLKAAIEKANVETQTPLWLIMIGHGTYSRRIAKFNLRGPDVSASQMSEWLKPITRPVVIVNCASSSAPFINQLSGKRRIVVTSTKSGSQQNFARFGEYFSRAIASAESDLDHDDEVSVQEAFLRASAEVQQFYDSESRICTEHALIDDNGDGRGTPAKMFRGVRPIGQAKDGAKLDGLVAKRITLAPTGETVTLTEEESKKRDDLEQKLEQLRLKKDELSKEDYDKTIEPLMIELAKIYRAAEARSE